MKIKINTPIIIKNIILIMQIYLAGFMFSSCTDLDVPVESELSSNNFPKTEEDFIYASGKIYTNLANYYFKAYWFLQEFSADGVVILAHAGNWYDGGRYQQLHMHTWNGDHRFVRQTWQSFFSGITICNSLIATFEESPDSEFKKTGIAEIRAMRALYYYLLIDLYGDVPLVKSIEEEITTRTNKKEVFKFIEDELLSIIPDLKEETGEATYGRPTKWMAYALLAKLYLNAEIYIEEDKSNETIAMCDKIIESGLFDLDEDFLKMFYPDNGPHVKDFIYAIPYDSYNISQEQYYCRYWLHPTHSYKFDLPYNPSGCARTLPEFYDLFNDPDDQRNGQWLAGKQYLEDGTPIAWETTNIGLDNDYSGPNPDEKVIYHLELTKELTFDNVDLFDTGDDALGRAVGYRNIKFYPDTASLSRNQSNDWPVFRFADILLTKAEAILRGGNATMGHEPLGLVNMVRERAGATPFTSVNFDTLLNERARELSFECWRRNDLIRFGKFESVWGLKTDDDINKRLFPVPYEEITLNPGFSQNPGY
ncbi:RagB/SusD family nutrient uptake outer membrane protein [Abyssalbus ytuae]|uniref:RagB/SusD family nutrient uptake outer membrane protein n=1 Tax=Abyssalbus ytuae TaxID=2926907 RepID=A0A9E6ZKB4_9FLAO|nr:RagB/SusD family nutrient uptake outer membrane protein [Abyssalbus ytuae]UOB17267.1 RagB/SusD family nutrient uptake outer membrane protein [Abyssalbus ytuae]